MHIRLSQIDDLPIAGTIDNLEVRSYLAKCSGTQLRKFLNTLECAQILAEDFAHKRFEWWED